MTQWLKSSALWCLWSVFGCAGEPFFYAAPESEGLDTANRLETSAGGQQLISNPMMANMLPELVEMTTGGPCGIIRAENAALKNSEVCIEESLFVMGVGDVEPVGEIAHWPEREITLSAFVVGKFEVTVARYRECVQAEACDVPKTNTALGCSFSEVAGPRELLPVTCVNYSQAQEFCTWDFAGSSLPTEAQWERAARGLTSQIYPWGDDVDCSRAVLGGAIQCQQYEGSLPLAVGSAPGGASPEGVHDLIGNAAEWVADWAGIYDRNATTNPRGPDTGSYRVYRGGGWKTPHEVSASYLRWTAGPGSTSQLSFRCARPANP